jgi:hypothetical protein
LQRLSKLDRRDFRLVKYQSLATLDKYAERDVLKKCLVSPAGYLCEEFGERNVTNEFPSKM